MKRPRKDVRYFVASQCHAATFDALNGFPVFLWHAGQDFPEGPEPHGVLREKWPRQPWFVLPGATKARSDALDFAFRRAQAISKIASDERIAREKTYWQTTLEAERLGVDRAKLALKAAKVDGAVIARDFGA